MRVTWPRAVGSAVVAALLAYAFVLAPQVSRTAARPGETAAAAARSRPAAGRPGPAAARRTGLAAGTQDADAPVAVTAAPRSFPPAGKKFIGIMSGTGVGDWSTLNAFIAAVHVQPSVYEFTQGWAVNQFNKAAIDLVAARGMLPLISWEPWDYADTAPGAQTEGDQPAYKLSNIADGRFDGYIRSWAEGVKSLRYTIAIRFAHEMNGNWYPWGMQDLNGNTPAQYVAAWRHVHDIFTQVGATNVIWIWSPNVAYPGSSPLAALYPGDQYVDWVGLSGYYGTPGMNTYESFDQIFDQTIGQLRAITAKPVVITETGGTDTGGYMTRFVTQMFQQLPRDHPDVVGVIWYEAVKGVDWRLATHPAAAAAFGQSVAGNPLYDTPWRPGMVPTETVPALAALR
jgi:mannan endo-1,4-beta-mannosidase